MNPIDSSKRGFFRRLMFGLAGLLCLAATSASAHTVTLCYVKVWADPDAWVIEVGLDPVVTEALFLGKTEDPHYRLDPANLEPVQGILEEAAKAFFRVETGGKILGPVDAGFRIDMDDCLYTIRYPRVGDGRLRLTQLFAMQSIDVQQTIVDVIHPDGSKSDRVFLTADEPSTTVSVPVPAASASMVSTTQQPSQMKPPPHRWFSFSFFKLGVEHITFGFDHLLFLGGLLVACRRPSDILAIVTSFTLAHSITLSVAALGLWAPPSRIVEPAIAASIVYVGVENLIRGEIGKSRAWLTFTFGLIHGFGFASVLRDIGLGQNGRGIAGPLFAFNVGIEAGQLTIVALVLPLLLKLQHASEHARRWLRPSLSVVIALAGLYWLLQRTVFAG